MSNYYQDPDDGDASLTLPSSITVNGIAALTTAGLTVQNTTPALVGAQVQRAPAVWQYGRAWDVDDAVSRTVGMGWQMRPVAGNTVSGALHLMRSIAGVEADVGLSLTSAGAFLLPHAYGPIVSLTEDDADVRDGLAWNATNTLVLGNIALGRVQLSADRGELYAGSTFVMRWDAAFVTMRIGTLYWDNNAALAPLIQQLDVNGANPFTLQSAGAASGNNNGTGPRLRTGRGQGSGTSGVGVLQGNRDNSTYDTCLSWSTSGSAATLGFFGTSPIAKPAVTGSRGANAALTDLLTDLAALGLITDSTSA